MQIKSRDRLPPIYFQMNVAEIGPQVYDIHPHNTNIAFQLF